MQRFDGVACYRYFFLYMYQISITLYVRLTVAYLCKKAPIAKFKCAPFLIIHILDRGTIFTKVKPCSVEYKCF